MSGLTYTYGDVKTTILEQGIYNTISKWCLPEELPVLK